MSKHKVSLSDRYTQNDGLIHLRESGHGAVVTAAAADLAAGRNTGGFVSGYRGSPMTAIDEELWRAGELLPEHHITFWPAPTNIWQ